MAPRKPKARPAAVFGRKVEIEGELIAIEVTSGAATIDL